MIRLPNSILCFFFKTKLDSCARAGLVGNIGKFSEKFVKMPKYRRYFQGFFGLLLQLLRVCLHSRFFSDLSVLHRYFADISTILSNFWRYSHGSIIDGDYHFVDDRYPIFPNFSIPTYTMNVFFYILFIIYM